MIRLAIVGVLFVSGCVDSSRRGIGMVVGEVIASVETVPVRSAGDAADDAAVWVHPSQPERSTVIGTDKTRGLIVYDLGGGVIQELDDGRMNNVDVVYGFPLGGSFVDLVGASNRTHDAISLYAVDPVTGTLRDVSARVIGSELRDTYGFCMMRSDATGAFYAFLNNYDGVVEQWRLFEREGRVDATLVRSFAVGGLTEGMVAHAPTNALFVGEEDVGVWRYEAEPAWLVAGGARLAPSIPGTPSAPGEPSRRLVAAVGRDPVAADIEGLAVYPGEGGKGGYLLVASQGDSTFAVFELDEPHAHLFSFRIVAGGGIDAVSGTDGIEVTAAGLGAGFPHGLLVVQDDSRPGSSQNFKLIPWERVEGASPVSLRRASGWDPRGRPAPSPTR